MTKMAIRIGIWVAIAVIVAPNATSLAFAGVLSGLGNILGGSARYFLSHLGDQVGESIFGNKWNWIKALL